MKKINLEILFLFGFILFGFYWIQGMFFNGRYGMLAIILFIIWLLALLLYMYQSKKESKLDTDKKDHKEVAGQLIYLTSAAPAVLHIYKDKLVIKEALFRFILLLLNKKEIVISKEEIKEIKLLNKWPYWGINIITNKYVPEELVFSIKVWKDDKDQWQKLLGEYGYKVE